MENTVDVRVKAKGVPSAFGGFEVPLRYIPIVHFYFSFLFVEHC